MAAIRETVEEAGVLLANQIDGTQAHHAQQYLQDRPDDFLGYCRKRQIQLQTAHVRYLSHWITLEGNPKRYDTRFFIAEWPQHQQPRQDNHETVDTVWITAQKTLDNYRRNQWLLSLPTIATLEQLCQYDNCEAILAHLGQSAAKL